MTAYPNYRVSVELLLKHQDKILIAKRANNCDVNPGVWGIPAGKVKYEEVPKAAAIRELKEETGIDAQIVKELSCRTATIMSKGEKAYRLFFTYLMTATSPTLPNVQLSDEHSEYAWVSKDDLS